MKRPDVHIDNFMQVYDHYATTGPSWMGKHVLFPLINHKYGDRVHTTFLGDAYEKIAAPIREGLSGHIFIANHASEADPLMLTAMMQQEGLRHQLHNTVTWGKASLFKGKTRIVADAAGSIPVFRAKDMGYQPGETLSPGDKDQLEIRSNYLIKTSQALLKQGRHIMLFPEGTINRDHYSELRFKDGLGRLACTDAIVASESSIVPMGIRYEQQDGEMHAHIAIEEPFAVGGIVYSQAENVYNQQAVLAEAREQVLTCLKYLHEPTTPAS